MNGSLLRFLKVLGGPALRRLAKADLRTAYNLNYGPPMKVETDVDAATLDALWDHIAGVWTDLGRTDPLWSVLTDKRYLSNAAPSTETVARFYDSGRLDYPLAILARSGLSPDQFPVVAEYGCGVGRMTRWLAQSFATVKAFDVSAPHLTLAREHVARHGLSNVAFVQLNNRDDLAQLTGVDLFFSLIVLQHNPPPIILDILDKALAGLNPGGVALFQVPTYSKGYRFTIADYWRDVAARKKMEMHFVPQAEIFALARRHGLSVLEVRSDHCLGSPDSAISNTFLLRKER